MDSQIIKQVVREKKELDNWDIKRCQTTRYYSINLINPYLITWI